MTIDQELELIEQACWKCSHYNDEDDSFCLKCGKPDSLLEMKRRELTHRQLCELGARWIINESHPASYDWRILVETGYRQENPDVFAFTRYSSVLIECKASRSDFLADKRKPFRKNPQLGVGMRRFYLVNDGVAKQEEMPEGWQLLIAYDKDTILMPNDYVPPTDFSPDKRFDIRNATNETELMWSWEYRKKHNCLPVFPIDPPNLIHPAYWQQEGWLEKNIGAITRKRIVEEKDE